MVPIALILLAIVILFSVAVVVSNPVPVSLSIFGAQIPVQTPAVYFTGAAAMLVTVVALLLLRTGVRRTMAQRRELRTLKKEAKAQGARGGDASTAVPAAGAKAVDSGATSTRTVGSTASGSGAAPGTPSPSGASSPAASPPAASTPAASPPAASPPAASPPAAQGSSTSAERQAWLAQADEITGDDPKR